MNCLEAIKGFTGYPHNFLVLTSIIQCLLMSIIPDNIFPCSNNDIFVTAGHKCISILLVTCILHLFVLKALGFSFLPNERIRITDS